METRRSLGAAAFLLGCLTASPAHAGFHFVQIEEVMAGANGNPAIQFIELSMLEDEENCQQSGEANPAGPFGCVDASAFPEFSAARLFFFDATGTPKGDLDQDGDPIGFPFPHNTPIAGAGRSILIGTQAFADLPTAPEPDFIMPAMPPMVEPNSGKICYSICTTCQGLDSVNDCLSYGAFSGDTEGFGSPAAALPITGTVSLRRVGSAANNATDFALGTPAPCANTGVCGTVVSEAADVSVTQSGSIGPVPVGNELAYVLTVTNAGPAQATGATLVDTLPTGSSFVFAAAEAAICSQSAGRVSCGLGDLAAGQSRTAVVVLTPTLPETLINTATVSSLAPDANAANDAAMLKTAVSCVGAGTQTLSGRIRAEKKGLARVTVTLRGAGGCLATAITDRRGNYTFAGVADGNYTVEPQRERSCAFKPRRRAAAIQGAGRRALFRARCR
ncbi:MAG: SdrD B-like domain-containing protein [Gammaproteobacteria bacterium]